MRSRRSAVADAMHMRLRRATAEQHRMLDHGLSYVLSDALTIDRYRALLTAFLGYYRPLEDGLMRLQDLTTVSVPIIRRAHLLEQDLRVLGVAPEGLPSCDQLPRLDTVDRLAGALYVVEGASLGGQVIARALKRQLGVERDSGAAFFTGDGSQTAARWKRVVGWLEERRNGESAGADVIDGACGTFDALWQWLSLRGVLNA